MRVVYGVRYIWTRTIKLISAWRKVNSVDLNDPPTPVGGILQQKHENLKELTGKSQ